MTTANPDELKQIVEGLERLAAEKGDIAEMEKERMAYAKGQGFDTKVIRKVLALRKMAPDDRAEMEAVTDMYKSALGMQ